MNGDQLLIAASAAIGKRDADSRRCPRLGADVSACCADASEQ